MKKYILIISAFFYGVLYCNAYDIHTDSTDNIINIQTKNMLEEIRLRNGIDTDTYRAGGNNIHGEPAELLTDTVPQLSENTESNGTTEIKQNTSEKPAFDNRRTAFATGLNISIGVSNSYYNIIELFKPVLEVDLDDMSNNLPKNGFDFTLTGTSNVFLNIYIKNKYEIGLYTSGHSYDLSNIPKNIIDFASKGNKVGEKITGTISGSTYIFVNTSMFFGMKIGNFKFKIDTSYFIPLIYIDYKNGMYEFHNDTETGNITAKHNIEAVLYTNIPNTLEVGLFKKIFKNGGLDLNLSGSYTFSPIANLNFSLNAVPLLAARMDNGWILTMDGKLEVESIMSYIHNTLLPNQNSQHPQGLITSFTTNMGASELPEKKVFRPLKLSVSSDIRPFGNNYLIITPNLGCSCYKPLYIDAGVKIESRFLKVLGAYYSLNREDRIWKNRIGFFLDARAFRLEASISSISTSFANSFKGKGGEAYIGLVIGW